MKINKPKILSMFFQTILLFISIVWLPTMVGDREWETVLVLCRYGTIIGIFLMMLLCLVQKRIYTPYNLFYMTFFAFQFGLPIVYTIFPTYINFYFNLFTNQERINGLIYSIFCIQLFVYISTPFIDRYKKTSKQTDKASIWKEDKIAEAGLILFVMMGLIAIPLMLYAALQTIVLGFGNAGTRGFLSSNAIFRLVQAFFIPSGLLNLCFEKNKKKRNLLLIVAGFYALLQLICADRAGGLVTLLVLAYYKFFAENKINKGNRTKLKDKDLKIEVLFTLVLMFLVVLLVYIAEARLTTETVSILDVLTGGIVIDLLSEVGFNFTSICFMFKYIPDTADVFNGQSYLVALLSLIPKSIDPTGTLTEIYGMLGETWLYNMNKIEYQGVLDFGVGFSLIAESYYNFGWAGILVFIPLALLIVCFLGKRQSSCSRMETYIYLVMMLEVLMLPRRQIYNLFKTLEYSIVFIFIYMCVYIWLIYKQKKE